MTQESYLVLWIYFTGLVFTLVSALLLTHVVKILAQRFHLTDKPDGARKIHDKPIPNIGGVAIVGVFFIGLGYFAFLKSVFQLPDNGYIQLPSYYIMAGGLIMAATGLYDDIYNLGFKKKFLLQVAVALLVIGGGFQIEALQNPFTGEMYSLGYFGAPITVFVIVGIINAVNLLDGMDGLAAGVALIAFVSLSIAYGVDGHYEHLVLVVTISGALLAFLRYNFNPASIFMGDTGSLFIGFLLATYALGGMNHAESMLAFLIPVICLGLPVLDTGLAITRRYLEGRPLFSPDCDHIHHRIARKFGFTHRRTVLLLYMVSLFLGLMAFLIAMADNILTTLLLCITAVSVYYFLKVLGYVPFKKVSKVVTMKARSSIKFHRTEASQKGE